MSADDTLGCLLSSRTIRVLEAAAVHAVWKNDEELFRRAVALATVIAGWIKDTNQQVVRGATTEHMERLTEALTSVGDYIRDEGQRSSTAH